MQDSYRLYISSLCILKLSLKTRKLESSVLTPNMQSNTRFINQSKLSTRLCKKMLSGKYNWRHQLHLSSQSNNKYLKLLNKPNRKMQRNNHSSKLVVYQLKKYYHKPKDLIEKMKLL